MSMIQPELVDLHHSDLMLAIHKFFEQSVHPFWVAREVDTAQALPRIKHLPVFDAEQTMTAFFRMEHLKRRFQSQLALLTKYTEATNGTKLLDLPNPIPTPNHTPNHTPR
jgi:hypothetical protein